MIEGGGSRITFLDGWRGLAILTVLFGHFGHIEPEFGNLGVELFFVLSGRLMAQILFEKQLRLPTFFKRRFSRIYPALLVYVSAIALLSLVAAIMGKNRGADLFSVLAALTFTANYMPALGHPIAGTLDHVWSLAVEEHCYALLATIALLTARRSRRARSICVALAVLAMINGARLFFEGAGGIHEIYWRTDVRLAPIFLSAALYLWKPKKFGFTALALSMLVFGFLPLPVRFIVPTIGLAWSVNAIDHSLPRLLKALSNPLLMWVGTVSYSLYLWQQLFYKMTNGNPVALVPVFAIAWLSYRYVEQPARRAINSMTFRFVPRARSI